MKKIKICFMSLDRDVVSTLCFLIFLFLEFFWIKFFLDLNLDMHWILAFAIRLVSISIVIYMGGTLLMETQGRISELHIQVGELLKKESEDQLSLILQKYPRIEIRYPYVYGVRMEQLVVDNEIIFSHEYEFVNSYPIKLRVFNDLFVSLTYSQRKKIFAEILRMSDEKQAEQNKANMDERERVRKLVEEALQEQ